MVCANEEALIVEVIDGQQDGINQISDILSRYDELEAIQIAYIACTDVP